MLAAAFVHRLVAAAARLAGIAAVCCVPGWAALAHAQVPAHLAEPLADSAPTWLQDQPAPVMARCRLELFVPGRDGAQVREWLFSRSANQVRLLKGEVEEVWRRDERGRISFDRIFHADRRTVRYSSGELRNFGITPDWLGLSYLVDPRGMRELPASVGAPGRVPLLGARAGQPDQLLWDSVRQLPARVVVEVREGALRMTCLEAPVTLLQAPDSGDYLVTDAADLADMAYDPFARKAAALEVRHGWRAAHQH